MSDSMNYQVKLAKRPENLPEKEGWEFTEASMPKVEAGEILVKILYISLDPAMRGWMNDAKSYIPPVQIGEVMRAIGVGKVIESKHENYAIGDYVTGMVGSQKYAALKGKEANKVDPTRIPLTNYLSGIGMPGMTAYFGLLEVGEAKEGDVVVISAASGAVGSVAGQIAKAKGCRVIGIAGGAEKCKGLIDEFGFDAAIDYKAEEKVFEALKKHCPDGINVYFDNVGGAILEAALANLARHARVVICGAISQYNSKKVQGPRNYTSLLVNRAKMEGFVVFDYAKKYPQAIQEMSGWYAEGKLKIKEHVEEGLENFHETFIKLFNGGNTGKLLLKVADDE